MTEHTKLPWKLAGNPDNMIVTDAEGGSIADCAPPGPWMRHKEALANAALIVKAVNCHDDLVEALKTAETALEALHAQLGCWKIASAVNVDGIRKAALTALAKAGE